MGKIVKRFETTFEDLNELFSVFNEGFLSIPSVLDKRETVLLNAESYLQKGEKLLTLAKEHFKRVCSNLSVTNFEEKFYGLKFESLDENSFSHLDYIVSAASKLMRRVLRSAESLDDESLSHVIQTIQTYYNMELNLNITESVRYRYLMGEKVIRLTLVEEGYYPLVVYGLKDKTHNKSNKNVLLKTGECVGDIATILATLYIFSITNRYMEDVSAGTADKSYLGFLLMSNYSGFGKVFNKKEAMDGTENLFSLNWVVPSDKESLFLVWEELFIRQGAAVEHSSMTARNLCKEVSRGILEDTYKEVSQIPLVFTDSTAKLLTAFMTVEVIDVFGKMPYISLLSAYGDGTHWPLINYHFSGQLWEKAILLAFSKVYEEKHGQVESLKTLKELDSEHAKSYQTKKNIPQKTLSAMESSSFNNYFGYVEYDEDVDLEAVKVIEDEFLAFKETHFSFIDASKNSLRFRRLGNHKALGLYYPSVKCLCVDIHSPSSFVHEFGHLIDYCYGNLSIKTEFTDIRFLYKSRLLEYMRKDDGFSKTMNGKTKYNLDYYLKPTEVFARCFEIYCVRVLNISNSIVKQEFGLPYPMDEVFIEYIKEYFEDVFTSLNATSKLPAVKKVAGH